MNHYICNGNTWRVAPHAAIDLRPQLPVGNYILKVDMNGEFYLETVESFTSPPKMYGDTLHIAKRFMTTFLDRSNATGILLTGEKGSGKTLLAKELSLLAAREHAIPTVMINYPFTGDKFNAFIQVIDQPCIILFDEFEKTYDEDQQEHVLTLLDGVFPSKKLFILTSNDEWRIDTNMRNRPGRLFYNVSYKGLSQEFVEEYALDNLNNKDHVKALVQIASIFLAFNFDMLKAIVEECNRFNETPQEAIKYLNVKPEYSGSSKFDVSIFVNGVKAKSVYQTKWEGSPLAMNAYSFYYAMHDVRAGEYDEENDVWAKLEIDEDQPKPKKLHGKINVGGVYYDGRIMIERSSLIDIDPRENAYTFNSSREGEAKGVTVRLVREPVKEYDWRNAL